MKVKKNNRKKSTLIIASALLLAALVTGGVLAWQALQPTDQTEMANTQDGSSINYDPPTDQEITSSQDGKKNAIKESENTTNKTEVQVGISYADIHNDNLEIRAFTNSVVTGDGTCTATVWKGSTRITKTSEAFIDASSSQCRPIYIPQSDLSSGSWDVTVSFSSPGKQGSSEVVKVSVP